MEQQKLNEQQKKDMKELKKCYKYIYICKCKRVYGSDLPIENICCPVCSQGLHLKKSRFTK